MAKNQQLVAVKDAVYKLQLSLLNGIRSEDQLFAAGSLMSCSDYNDAVTERSIANLCGYPLCSNSLPSDRPRKGRYRISLKEHKVYDLQETYMYCSSACLINSRAFGGSLKEERCSALDSGKIDGVLRLFEDSGLEGELGLGNDEALGFSGLKIQEKTEISVGEVGLEEWVGPSNAIEGYVPHRERNFKLVSSKSPKQGSKANNTLLINDIDFASTIITEDEYTVSKTPSIPEKDVFDSRSSEAQENVCSKGAARESQREQKSKPVASTSPKRGSKANNTHLINDMDFASVIIAEDEYTVSKIPSNAKKNVFDTKLKEPKENLGNKGVKNQSTTPKSNDSERKSRESDWESSKTVPKDNICDQDTPSTSVPSQHGSHVSTASAGDKSQGEKADKLIEASLRSSLKPSRTKKLSRSVTWADQETNGRGRRNLCEIRDIDDVKDGPKKLGTMDKIPFKPSGAMKAGPSLTWVDEKTDNDQKTDLCEVREVQDTKEAPAVPCDKDTVETDDMLRFTSAEVCARALTDASEAVSSSGLEGTDAMFAAGIIVLPSPDIVDEGKSLEDDDVSEPEQAPVKWPRKPGVPNSDLFDSEDSWFDAPPDGFNLTLSTFAKLWNALFTWTSSSTLAYIYGRDESFHEEYLSVNGREYLQKIVLGDGRSSEIKQTLAGSLSRALPGLVSDLKLSTPISSLEQGMARLLDTMSFTDALPPFRMKQWQVIVLLFIEALSVYRLPALTTRMTNRPMLFNKVLDGAQISAEEYEIMKDLLIPLGRATHLSAQSGALMGEINQ